MKQTQEFNHQQSDHKYMLKKGAEIIKKTPSDVSDFESKKTDMTIHSIVRGVFRLCALVFSLGYYKRPQKK